jgi:carbamoyltransferase
MAMILGIAGASRMRPALCHAGRVLGVCEHARVTRTRRAALRQGQLPGETLQTMLRLGGCSEQDITAYAVAEARIQLPSERRVEYVDHHLAHAATAFYSSPFTDATILVCDRGGSPELTVWRADGEGIRRQDFSWNGPGFASVYSQAAEAMGFGPGDEHRFEALARVGERCRDLDIPAIGYDGDHSTCRTPTGLDRERRRTERLNRVDGPAVQPREQLQRQVGDLLLRVVLDISRGVGGSRLCLAGGLFYNSYFRRSWRSLDYEETFVPPNPGNAGVAVGAALAASSERPWCGTRYRRSSGRRSAEEIKAILDNCKLSYDYLRTVRSSSGRPACSPRVSSLDGSRGGWSGGRAHSAIAASSPAPWRRTFSRT